MVAALAVGGVLLAVMIATSGYGGVILPRDARIPVHLGSHEHVLLVSKRAGLVSWPVVGAVVQLKDVRTLQMRSYITQANGEYHFSSLKIDDDYELEARNNSLTSGPKKISIFDNRKVVIQNLKADKPEKQDKQDKR